MTAHFTDERFAVRVMVTDVWDQVFLAVEAATTVAELAETVWRKINGPDRPVRLAHDPPYEYDVQLRAPDVGKAADVLGFRATTTLEQMLDEVIPWLRDEMMAGRI